MTQEPHQKSGRDAILERLKAYARSGVISGNAAELIKSIESETDRGAVIILASLLEDVLTSRLLKRMEKLNSAERKGLFGFDGIIGTFSAKIRMSRALGIVDRGDAQVLDTIRIMRNSCAHSRRGISFDTAELREALTLIIDEDNADLVIRGEAAALKVIYVAAVSYIIDILVSGSEQAARERFDQIFLNAVRGGHSGPPPDAAVGS